MRSYNEYCALARALDAVGQRWSLLIVRELLIRGACRYTDLLDGLPGIATNLLADRLRDLEEVGVVVREEAPAPVATTLFRLTERGAELKGVVASLASWGAQLVARPIGDEHVRGHWLKLPLELFLRDGSPDDTPTTLEIASGDATLVAEASAGQVSVRLGTADRPDARLEGSPSLVLGLLTGRLDTQQARRRGLRVEGEERVIERLRSTPVGP